MCWGIACGDGWYPLIDALCHCLQQTADFHEGPQAVARQIKEKLGRLRIHLVAASPEQRAMITLAGEFSERLCEVCGSIATPKSGYAYQPTRCGIHRE